MIQHFHDLKFQFTQKTQLRYLSIKTSLSNYRKMQLDGNVTY